MRSTSRATAVALAVALAAAGCAHRGHLYRWGNYDQALYDLARSPQGQEQYLEALKEIIENAEASQTRVAPGLYAEYGYALAVHGQLDDALVFYAKERDTWPESRVLMEKMIRNTQRLREARPASPRDGPPVPLPAATPGAAPAAAPAAPEGRS